MISKLRSRPPIASADDFIAGADQQTAAVEPPGQAPPAPLPWEDSQVLEDVLKVYNLRLPEPYLLSSSTSPRTHLAACISSALTCSCRRLTRRSRS